MANEPTRASLSLKGLRSGAVGEKDTWGDRETLIYAMVQWSRRRRGAMEAVREQATRQLYREGAREESIEAELDPPDTSAAHSPRARANGRVTRQY
jgi:hypothetical protein